MAGNEEAARSDPLFGKGSIRADGRELHRPMVEVKKPAESKAPWDLLVVTTIPADQAFRPIDQGDCPLMRRQGRGAARAAVPPVRHCCRWPATTP
ncbi:MAG: hypothetical protein U1E95_07490 [Rubrivivax sp.]